MRKILIATLIFGGMIAQAGVENVPKSFFSESPEVQAQIMAELRRQNELRRKEKAGTLTPAENEELARNLEKHPLGKSFPAPREQ